MCYDYSVIYKLSPNKLPKSRSRKNVSGVDIDSCKERGINPETGTYFKNHIGVKTGKSMTLPNGRQKVSRSMGRLCESITFGYVQPAFTKRGTIKSARANSYYPEFYKELKRMIKSISPDFKYDSICVNHNLECIEHRDKYNKASSIIVGWGDYEGGDLWVEGVPFNIKEYPLRFNGGICSHKTLPFKGDRWTAIFFNKYDYHHKIYTDL